MSARFIANTCASQSLWNGGSSSSSVTAGKPVIPPTSLMRLTSRACRAACVLATGPQSGSGLRTQRRSPGADGVVLEEHGVQVGAALALDDRVVDARGAVDEVERGVEALG